MRILTALTALVLLRLAVADPPASAQVDGPPREVLVVNTQDASVSRVDLASMKETGRFTVGERPYGIAVLGDGKRVAVGVEAEEGIEFFALDGFESLGAVPVGTMHNDHLILSADGRFVLDANFHADAVIGVDVAAMKEAFRIGGLSAPHVVKYGPKRTLAYVTCKKVTGIGVIDPAQRTVVQVHPLNVNPRSLTFSLDERRLYFGSFWVDGFFEMDPKAGKVTRLFHLEPPAGDATPQEVTYHGVESVGPTTVLAANEGRSYVDAVDTQSGRLRSRLTDRIAKPCCIERIPGTTPVEVLVSNLGDGTLARVRVSADGVLETIGAAKVGAGPKRVAFVR
jgi:DNA-binding beta-propeller fold protein YncE